MPAIETPQSAITCLRCQTTRTVPLARSGTPRTPKGWKIFRDQIYCQKCKHIAYVLRALTLPVSGPLDGTWPDFRVALRTAWGESTRCANWMTTEFYARDIRRAQGETKLAKMPRVYLYPEARMLFPSLPSQAVASLEQELQGKYRAQRYDLLWTQTRTLASHRYPYPIPIPSQGWTLATTEADGRWQVTFRLGDRRWTVQLQGGPHMRYMAAGLKQLITGTAFGGALSLYQVTSHPGDHRTEGLPQRRVMLKIPAWFPRADPKDAAGIMTVRTSGDEFLIATHEDRTWTLHADHIRRVVVAYDKQRFRLSEDLKAERRRPRAQREGMVDRMGQMAERQHHRLTTWTHDASRQVVNYAKRQGVAAIQYDDTIRSYVRSYPWAALRQAIEQKAQQAGLLFELATPDTSSSTEAP
jgi:hypothetical protein